MYVVYAVHICYWMRLDFSLAAPVLPFAGPMLPRASKWWILCLVHRCWLVILGDSEFDELHSCWQSQCVEAALECYQAMVVVVANFV